MKDDISSLSKNIRSEYIKFRKFNNYQKAAEWN